MPATVQSILYLFYLKYLFYTTVLRGRWYLSDVEPLKVRWTWIQKFAAGMVKGKWDHKGKYLRYDALSVLCVTCICVFYLKKRRGSLNYYCIP